MNKYTVKAFYRTMPIMAQINLRHNKQAVKQQKQQQPLPAAEVKTCSCPKAVRSSGTCPMVAQRLQTNTIYQATVTKVTLA